MLINPKIEERKEGIFKICGKVKAYAGETLLKPVFMEFWKNFCSEYSEISIEKTTDFIFKIGEGTPSIPEKGYEIDITKKGITVSASDDKSLIYGFFALLERIECDCDESGKPMVYVPCLKIKDFPKIDTRIIHFCVFPETDLQYLKKEIRLAAFLRYTHIIVEFWGMIKYNCLDALGWKNAYSKEQMRPIFSEARDLGVEIIPMFNHWGHASSSRLLSGKHVVLDNDLRYSYLFDRSGWNWKLNSQEVKTLLKKIRYELMELCGEGEYFHIGCDEAYGNFPKEHFADVASYINSVSEDLALNGRKTIMWGDMLLCNDTIENRTSNSYITSYQNKEIQKVLLDVISRDIIIADWQYNAVEYPIETALFLKDKGFRVLCCPWDRNPKNILSIAKTVKDYGLMGIMHTTWNTKGFCSIALSATAAWEECGKEENLSAYIMAKTANIVRKLCPSEGDYKSSGWIFSQTNPNLG